MYVYPNFKTIEQLKEAIAAGQEVVVFQPGFLGSVPADGTVTLEGPYPEPHRWYAQGTMREGRLVDVK